MSNKLRFSTNGFSSNGNGKKPKSRVVRGKTDGQRAYMEAIESHDIVYCLGPAGTGKTHIAAGMAARGFNDGTYERIVAVRPAVEAGNSLGFLPGELDDKIKPYLRPFLAELAKFIPEEELRRLRQGELPKIELSPLQYMRGSTLENSIIVLDEAQNATRAEIWMFLTRLGEGSKMIINGDTSRHEDGTMKQCDLPRDLQGGVEYYAALYADYEEIGIVTMTEADIVRHPLVKKMMKRS
jgi:phosphate starvation-inducible PhoH-like protein